MRLKLSEAVFSDTQETILDYTKAHNGLVHPDLVGYSGVWIRSVYNSALDELQVNLSAPVDFPHAPQGTSEGFQHLQWMYGRLIQFSFPVNYVTDAGFYVQQHPFGGETNTAYLTLKVPNASRVLLSTFAGSVVDTFAAGLNRNIIVW